MVPKCYNKLGKRCIAINSEVRKYETNSANKFTYAEVYIGTMVTQRCVLISN